jgi:hypothetical protein
VIQDAVVRLALPDASMFLEMPGVAEAGWHVEQGTRTMVATRAGLPASAQASVVAEFSIEGLTMPRPVWQFQQARASEFTPAFISAGLFILVVGFGVVAMMWFRFRSGATPIASDAERRIDRARAVRDLRRSGYVALMVGAVATGATAWLPGGFGPWSYAVAASVVANGIIFIAAAAVFRTRDGTAV